MTVPEQLTAEDNSPASIPSQPPVVIEEEEEEDEEYETEEEAE